MYMHWKDIRSSTWKNVETVENTQALIDGGGLPDKFDLTDLVRRLGRKSAVVELVCKQIYEKIKAALPICAYVYAAYTKENDRELHFSVYLESEGVQRSDLCFDYDILFRSCKTKDQADPYNLTTYPESELLAEESSAVNETINIISKQYMTSHKFLSAITARKISFEREESLCIVMYVHPCTNRYYSIPHTEEPLPSTIQGYKVVVRNGVFKTASDPDYQDNLLMGCKISSDFSDGFGTLGGFIDHPEYGLCGFTCAHVVYNTGQLKKLKDKERQHWSAAKDPCLVYQPSKEDEHIIGRVVEATLTKGGENNSAGVDLALIQIEDRHPVAGTFPYGSTNENLQYVTGKTWGKTRIKRSNEIQKCGYASGITSGKVMFDRLSVREIGFQAKDMLGGAIFLNQYEIVNENMNVCKRGDSGGLVFTKDYTNDLICIGMVIGVLNDADNNDLQHGVVTPITDILRELKVQNLKPFKEELTVAHLEKKLSENVKETKKMIQTTMNRMQKQNLEEMRKEIQSIGAEMKSFMKQTYGSQQTREPENDVDIDVTNPGESSQQTGQLENDVNRDITNPGESSQQTGQPENDVNRDITNPGETSQQTGQPKTDVKRDVINPGECQQQTGQPENDVNRDVTNPGECQQQTEQPKNDLNRDVTSPGESSQQTEQPKRAVNRDVTNLGKSSQQTGQPENDLNRNATNPGKGSHQARQPKNDTNGNELGKELNENCT
ncbi:uncharacterized protein LOC123540067 [Mercenaria mercenaria]|uniref:uncharacterized protein LOC123540067 n=1 Tax=Mercenaria mercenaria TaxID=6596 RepID=UPI00234E5ED3|nr:uncharacterized protein LOC123540067 [Mercenaria mercenaria]